MGQHRQGALGSGANTRAVVNRKPDKLAAPGRPVRKDAVRLFARLPRQAPAHGVADAGGKFGGGTEERVRAGAGAGLRPHPAPRPARGRKPRRAPNFARRQGR